MKSSSLYMRMSTLNLLLLKCIVMSLVPKDVQSDCILILMTIFLYECQGNYIFLRRNCQVKHPKRCHFIECQISLQMFVILNLLNLNNLFGNGWSVLFGVEISYDHVIVC
jgi:hypothetical protein